MFDKVTGGAYITQQDDIFALGMLILSIFDARIPYLDVERKAVLEMYSQPSGPAFPPISERIDPRIRAVVVDCWEKRYQTAQGVGEALREISKDLRDAPLVGDEDIDPVSSIS